jgi:serine/threonine protein kinase
VSSPSDSFIRASGELSSFAPGKRLADYVFVRPIAKGNYGEVWLVRNCVTGYYRALKLISTSSPNSRLYERELQAVKAIEPISRSHPGFVDILHVGEFERGFFYVMELADDLADGTHISPATYTPRTLQGRKITVKECIDVGISLSEALAVLHGKGLLHRDVKPSNIIFVDGRPKLADIGLVAALNAANSFVGTEGFVPPEGPKNVQADIFALGKVLYELSTGKDRLEFPALPLDPPKDHDLFLELNAVILRACDDDPHQRFKSIDQLSSELHFIQSGKSVQRIRRLEKTLKWGLRAFLIFLLVGTVSFGVYEYKQTLFRQKEAARQREVGTLIARGTEKLRHGEYIDALPEFLSLLQKDPQNEKDHRLRIASSLWSSISPVYAWGSLSGPAAISADGKTLAAGERGIIRLYDLPNGSVRKNFEGISEFLALNSNASVVAAGDGNVLKLFQDEKGAFVQNFPDRIIDAAFDPNDNLALCFDYQVWLNFRSQNERHLTFTNRILRAFFSPSGKYLGVACYDGHLLIINSKSAELLPFSPTHHNIVYHSLFLEDDGIVITASLDRSAQAWRIDTGEKIGLPLTHNDGVAGTIFAPRYNLFVTAGIDQTLRFWSRTTFTPVETNPIISVSDRLVGMYLLPSNLFLTHSDRGSNVVWSLTPQRTCEIQEIPFQRIPEKRRISTKSVSLIAEENRVHGVSFKSKIALDFSAPVEVIAYHEQKKLLAVGTRDDGYREHAVKLYDSLGRDTGVQLPHDDGIIYVTFSHDGSKVLTCSEDFSASIWDLTGKRLAPLRQRHQVTWGDFSKDDRWLITASADGTATIWDSQSGEPLTPPLRFPVPLDYVRFDDRDEALIATGKDRSFSLRLPILDREEETHSLLLRLTAMKEKQKSTYKAAIN